MERQLCSFLRSLSLLLVLTLSCISCSTMGYLHQGGVGQLRLFSRAKPVSEVLLNPRTDAKTRFFLSQIEPIKRFAEEAGLKQTNNYEEYVDWGREDFVHLLVASKPDRFEAKTWSFPIVGSFPYLGFFHRADADAERVKVEEEGYETDIRRADAYSSLGWFRDPLISTMMPADTEQLGELAHLIFHESVHATFSVPDQTLFNEQLAEFVADQMTPRFLVQLPKGDLYIKRYQDQQKHQTEIQNRMLRAYKELDELYSTPDLKTEEVASRKAAVLQKLKVDLGSRRNYNNASLIHVKTYVSQTRDFLNLWKECNGDLEAFLRVIRQLREESFPGPQTSSIGEVLKKLRSSSGHRQQHTLSHE
jgi:predicted aminopeptidase